MCVDIVVRRKHVYICEMMHLCARGACVDAIGFAHLHVVVCVVVVVKV